MGNGAGSVATYLEMSVDLIGCEDSGDAHITLDDVSCGAGATSLSDCTSTTSENCACSEGIIVRCDEEETTEAPGVGLWLDDNNQVRYNDGFVCDDGFYQESADMVCKVVNGAGSVATYLETSVDLIGCEDSGDAHITLDSVDCGAEAMSLSDCSYSDDYEDCSCGEGIIVRCDEVVDCAGVLGGSAEEDECGVCNGDNSSCADCAGVPNGDAAVDECGACNGDNSSCADCAGVPNGDAQEDACGVCNGNNACLTTTAGPETTEEEITCASFGSDKKGCKKTSKDYGLKCKWQKHTSPKMCTNKDWIPVCSEYTDNKKSCKKLGCDWDKVTGICSGLEVCEEEDMTWGEVSGIVQTTGKVKHKFVASVEECMATADALGAVAIIYEQYNPKQLCFTYTGIGGYAAGSSADSEFVTYAKDCY